MIRDGAEVKVSAMIFTEFYLVALINIVLNSYAATILTLTIIGGVLYLCMKNKISDKNDESNEDNDNVDTDENDDLEEVVTEKPATTGRTSGARDRDINIRKSNTSNNKDKEADDTDEKTDVMDKKESKEEFKKSESKQYKKAASK
ncbi:serine/threonine-protein kinase rio2-like isoform X2 [Dendropsophus ebraccatus]|uniref:serine/threonine-protein kinase rio2-like isoform X2 n=1 Tax=Dendropsophus ebraccatus TaxID=150705 RepID=UPI003831209D